MRVGQIERKTSETHVKVSLGLDGTGSHSIKTGVGFFDHLLSQFARHGLYDLTVSAKGDLHVDFHHTVEDVGICLGQALIRALAEGTGIARFGHALAPMDEALVLVALDISGRGFSSVSLNTPAHKVGTFDVELAPEFLRAFAVNGAFTLHVRQISGENTHHLLEATFKGLGLALRQATALDPRQTGIPSTKGSLL